MNYAEMARQGRANELNGKKAELKPYFPLIMDLIVDRISGNGDAHFRDDGIFIQGYGKIETWGKMEALAQMIEAEGFKVNRWWWGYSAHGDPNGLDISL